MADKKKKQPPEEETPQAAEPAESAAPESPPEPPPDELRKPAVTAEEYQRMLAAAEDKFLRLAAEYDNYRKRTAKEKEHAWLDAKIQTVSAILPVYDNLERALKQETADEAYAKGVIMTMKGLQDVLARLDIETIPALGETFDPKVHNAVMHVDDDSVEENTIVEVFQQGFMCADKVIRFAMVKVAN